MIIFDIRESYDKNNARAKRKPRLRSFWNNVGVIYASVARAIFALSAQSICRFASGAIFARMRAIDIHAPRE